MSYAGRALLIMTVGLLGLWGCSQGMSGNAERLKALEARITRLEDELKSTIASRDAYKNKLITANETVSRLEHVLSDSQAALQVATKELNDTRSNLQTVRKELTDAKSRLLVLTTELNSVQAKVQLVSKERDQQKELAAKNSRERDNAMGQYNDFRKSIGELLGRADIAAQAPLDQLKKDLPIIPTSTPKPEGGKSNGS